MSGPLSHIVVLDLSRVVAAPWASQMLADLGARVIKVERPGSGDDTRRWGPPFLRDAEGRETRESGYFLAANRGKESLTVDLSSPEGQEIIRKLAARSDIVLENYKFGDLARYGLDYERLKTVNPGLIYCSITGFGQNGPRRDQVAYDFMIQAMAGLMSVTGERDGRPGAGPQKVGLPIVDVLTGLYATVGILAALARRNETGRGDYLDVAMFDSMAGTLINQGMSYLLTGKPPARTGNRHPNIQPQDVFACLDGDLALAVGNDGQFAKLCAVLERAELASDPRFHTNAARVQHHEALREALSSALATQTRAHWSARLSAAGVPCGPINRIDEVFSDPQLQARGMLVKLRHPLGGEIEQVASPIRLREAPVSYDRPPPLLGEHTARILAELDYSPETIADLAARAVV